MKYYKGLIPLERKFMGWEKDEDGKEKRIFHGHYSMVQWVRGWEPDNPCIKDDIKWIKNEPFNAQLTIVDYIKGRSAVNFLLEDLSNGQKYYMTLKEMFNLIADITTGIFNNKDWIYAKKGSNYSIIPYKSV